MEKYRGVMGSIAVVLVIIISLLLYYVILTGRNLFEDLAILGIVSIILSIASYLLHSLIRSGKVVSGFVWGYYTIGIGSLLLDTTVIKFNIPYLAVVLLFILFSMVFIYWRFSSMKS